MKIDMTNIAYTEEYNTYLNEYKAIFDDANYKETEIIDLSSEYSMEIISYSGSINGRNLTASENILKDHSGKETYRFRNMDTGGDFRKLITHSNGRQYLIHKTDLYGYGVFDLALGKEFRHIPKGPESFIWTDVDYNPSNNKLVVSGCFWACPYGTHILDFTNPMTETDWIDVQRIVDEDYEKYDDVDFSGWDGDMIILKVYDNDSRQTREIRWDTSLEK